MLYQLLSNLGAWGLTSWRKVAEMALLFTSTVADLFRTGKKGFASNTRQIVSQILFTGVEAFWLVSAIGLLFGITIVVIATTSMPKIGAGDFFGKILVAVIINQLGPFFTAIVIAGRSGSALATYIANMKVHKEVAALEVMGIDPRHFLVMPAFVGMTISMVALSFYFDFIGILGGLIVAIAVSGVNLPLGILVDKVIGALGWLDLAFWFLKSVLFGGIVAIICCYNGLSATNPRMIPQAARKSVVGSMVVTLILTVIVTVVVWQIQSFLAA